MSNPSDPQFPWTEATIERLNARLDVVPDDDIGSEDWPSAMADPFLVETALAIYDSPDTGDDERALLVEWLLNTFEFCSIEREGNPDWRGTLDRIERDFALHAPTVQRWAEPEDGNPWIISDAMLALQARKRPRD